MAAIIEKKGRNLIPNWRSFSTTITLGELDSASISTIVKPNLSIEDYIVDFHKNETIPFAADLVSASIVNGFTDNEDVKKAAKFILNRQNQVTQSQYDISKKILSPIESSIECPIDNITSKELESCLPEQEYRLKIQRLKKSVIDFQYNSIAWVELSRCYSILGQKKQAIKSMKIAVQLAPENRFVLRCAVRLFSHYEELDLAHDILRKKNVTNFDPWLMSAEISVANLRGRNSKFIKRGIELVYSKDLSPFSITELASSIGTVELSSGNNKKSIKMFNKSLIAPNDNSLAQIEWILNNKDKSLINKERINIQPKHSFEAKAISNFHDKKLIDALNNTCQWFCDMPFSKRPVIMGSSIADILDDRKLSIDFLKLGLMSHSNDGQMLNNIAYYLALEDKTKDALDYLEKARKQGIEKSEATDICITATQGLIYFRENKYEAGRKEYLKAIEQTKLGKNESLNRIAILNYAREEILAKSDKVESVMQDVNKISELDDANNISIMALKSKVLKLYEEYKEKIPEKH
jgi:tetratricopeptide (TPR) repeat protein